MYSYIERAGFSFFSKSTCCCYKSRCGRSKSSVPQGTFLIYFSWVPIGCKSFIIWCIYWRRNSLRPPWFCSWLHRQHWYKGIFYRNTHCCFTSMCASIIPYNFFFTYIINIPEFDGITTMLRIQISIFVAVKVVFALVSLIDFLNTLVCLHLEMLRVAKIQDAYEHV